MTYLIAPLICFLAGWSIAASEALFRMDDRPGIFRGMPGTFLLLVLTGVGAIFATGGVLWIFRAIPSSAVVVLIAGAGWLGFEASSRLQVNAAGAINRLLVGVAGLLILYGVAWTFLPPPRP